MSTFAAPRPPDEIAAFTAIYHQYVVMVRGRARRILQDGEDAQDVTQEVFIKLANYLRKRPEVNAMGALLFHMTTQAAVRKLHSRRSTTHAMDMQSLAAASAPLHEQLLFKELLACVSSEQAQVATYYFIDGLTLEEIAAAMGSSRRSVSRSLGRFCDKARRLTGGPPISPTECTHDNDADPPSGTSSLAGWRRAPLA